jgi:hypothetical protein
MTAGSLQFLDKLTCQMQCNDSHKVVVNGAARQLKSGQVLKLSKAWRSLPRHVNVPHPQA